MGLAASCPRCTSPLRDGGDSFTCQDHGRITPLWRPATADYPTLAEHIRSCSGIPTLLPWPLSPGWSISDFGCVVEPPRDACASMLTVSGPTELDGVVELSVVVEEPGVGLGSRCAGVDRTDPGGEVGEGRPHAKVRLDGHPVAVWSVSTSQRGGELDRSVFVGEAVGRWLWLVLRPASAALLLHDMWVLSDVTDLGPELIDAPFGGSPPPW